MCSFSLRVYLWRNHHRVIDNRREILPGQKYDIHSTAVDVYPILDENALTTDIDLTQNVSYPSHEIFRE